MFLPPIAVYPQSLAARSKSPSGILRSSTTISGSIWKHGGSILRWSNVCRTWLVHEQDVMVINSDRFVRSVAMRSRVPVHLMKSRSAESGQLWSDMKHDEMSAKYGKVWNDMTWYVSKMSQGQKCPTSGISNFQQAALACRFDSVAALVSLFFTQIHKTASSSMSAFCWTWKIQMYSPK